MAADNGSWLDDTELAAWVGLIKLASRIVTLSDGELRRTRKITGRDYELLHHLSSSPQGWRVNELAEVIDDTSSCITHRVNRLQAAGLVEKRHPGKQKTGRQVTISTDLVYDVLRRHEPDHILMRATWADAATGLLDIGRLGDMLARIKGRIVHQRLDHISPLAVPIMLDIGKEAVPGEAEEDVLREAADDLVREAMGGD